MIAKQEELDELPQIIQLFLVTTITNLEACRIAWKEGGITDRQFEIITRTIKNIGDRFQFVLYPNKN